MASEQTEVLCCAPAAMGVTTRPGRGSEGLAPLDDKSGPEQATGDSGTRRHRLRSAFEGCVRRASERLPTVRARLYALVLLALVPALVILGYDEWLARQRGFAALADVSNRVVRLLQRELDGRISRAASRLGALVAEPEVVSVGPLAGRRLVDAFQADRLYNNLALVDGSTGEPAGERRPLRGEVERARPPRRTSGPCIPSTSRSGPSTRTSRPHEAALNVAQPAIDERGRVASVVCASLDMDWAADFIGSSGLPDGTILNVFDEKGVLQYRSIEPEKYVGRSIGPFAGALAAAGRRARGCRTRHRRGGAALRDHRYGLPRPAAPAPSSPSASRSPLGGPR